MNKYQEALKRLKQETAPVTYCADFNKEECINILQELVDKATPKKPKTATNETIKFTKYCPECKKLIPFPQVYFKYCAYCGQALDWSDEDE